MIKKKSQKFKEGAIVKINLSNDHLIFGRLLPFFDIAIYDLVIKYNSDIPLGKNIILNKAFLHVTIYKNIITKGIFEIIDYIELTQKELFYIPPKFYQSLGDYEDCKIYYNDGRQYKVSPVDCIGLERSAVWGEKSLIERIEDYYKGKANFHVEHQKVILSSDDVRYLNPDVRWDFNAGKFYK